MERQISSGSTSRAVARHVPATRAGKTPSVLRSSLVVMGPSALVVLALAIALVATLFLVVQPPTLARMVAGLLSTGLAVFLMLVRPWYLRWGADDDEVGLALPGDDILSRPVAETTRAITITAPAREVWPWLLQMGQGRGGLYSYDWLENLAGLDIHSVDRLVPALQSLRVGDPVPLGPGPHNGFVTARIEHERALVLRLDDPARGGPVDHARQRWADVSYSFVLKPLNERVTRLVLRYRFDGRPRGVMGWGYALFIEVPHFVMERKMLLGIKRRVEGASGRDTGRQGVNRLPRPNRAEPGHGHPLHAPRAGANLRSAVPSRSPH
jgi:hypothetical protein